MIRQLPSDFDQSSRVLYARWAQEKRAIAIGGAGIP